MASSPQQSLQSRLFGTWAASGDEVVVFQIDKDSLYYIDEDPIVAISYQFAGDSMSLDYWGNIIVQHISFRKDTLVWKISWARLVVLYPLKQNELWLILYKRLIYESTLKSPLFGPSQIM